MTGRLSPMFAGDARRRPARFRSATAWANRSRVSAVEWLVLGCVCLGGLALGCATGWVHEAGRFTNERRGLSITEPPGGPWQQVKIEGSALTLRNPSGATLSWLRECGDHPATARSASRALLRGIEGLELQAEGPVAGAAGDVWRAEARLSQDGRELQVRAVTRVVGGCTDDWLLVAPPATELAEAFDGWWASVQAPELAPGRAGEAFR